MPPIIFHIDMNSYFASCEQLSNPHLRGRPVGVCEHLGGIIIAPSVEAKKLGIKTACPVWEARKICPAIVLLPVDPPKYRHITSAFLKIFSEYTGLVERYSIDEAFLDVSSGCDWRSAPLLALEIKQRIKREIGGWLTCSVGIGPNKLVAKIASDFDKPDGVFAVKPEDVDSLYGLLQLTDIPGIAARTERRLNALGIFTIRDLSLYPEAALMQNFGISGHYLHEMGNFRGVARLVTQAEEEVKSMGHSYTLPSATSDLRVIKKLLFKLSEKVASRLRNRDFWGSVISCYARFAAPGKEGRRYDGEGASRRIHDFVNDGKLIFGQAWRIFQGFYRGGAAVRMAAVTVSGLVENLREESLFERYRKPQRMLAALDRINGKYGDFTLRRAQLLDARGLAPDTVGFGRMKEME